MTRILAAALPILVAGCAMPSEEGRAYVVLDEGARRAGLSIEHGNGERSASVRPLAIDTQSDATFLIDATGAAEPLELAPDQVLLVRGAAGDVARWPLGVARPDILIARANDQDAQALATTLGAELAPGANGATFELLGVDVWSLAAGLTSDPRGVIELLPLIEGAPLEDDATDDDARGARGPEVSALDTGAVHELLAHPVAPGSQAVPAFRPMDPLRDAAPASLAFARAIPGRYAMQLRDGYTGGCSRTRTRSDSLSSVSLVLAPGGGATACRARRSQSSSTSLELRRTAQGEGMFLSDSAVRSRAERHGYRGEWSRDGDAIAVVLRRDDGVCAPLAEGRAAAPTTWRLRCAAVRTHDTELVLPGAGLACSVAAEPWGDNDGYTIRSLDNATALWMLLGPGTGWRIRSEGMRLAGYGHVEVTRATERIDPRRAVDFGQPISPF